MNYQEFQKTKGFKKSGFYCGEISFPEQNSPQQYFQPMVYFNVLVFGNASFIEQVVIQK